MMERGKYVRYLEDGRKIAKMMFTTSSLCNAENQNDVDALTGVEILMPEGEMSPNKLGKGSNSVPSISYTAVQNLGIGDPISQVYKFLFYGHMCIYSSHNVARFCVCVEFWNLSVVYGKFI